MRRAKRIWQGTLIAGAAALILFLVAPVFGSSHGPDADRLRLTNEVDVFFYGSQQPVEGTGVTIQDVSAGKSCEISQLSGPLVTWSSGGGGKVKGPGIVKHGIGVKSGGSKGTPCSQVSDGEQLVIVGANPWIRLELDVEAKGNAWIHVQLYDGETEVGLQHQLLTGGNIEGSGETPAPGFPYTASTSAGNEIEACANPSDSGPDSGPNDNCRWFIDPGASFNKIVLWASVGSVSLEGGNDFASFDPTGFAAGDFDSLFYRANQAPVAGDDAYVMDERVPDTTTIMFNTLVVVGGGTPDLGLLGNDTDPNGDSLTVTGVDETGLIGFVTSWSADGSFTYTPDPSFDWEPPGLPQLFSYTTSFTYAITDDGVPPMADPAPATVFITVNRVACSDEDVGDTDGGITGTFTLLSSVRICKHYEVSAHQGDLPPIGEPPPGFDPSTITFVPHGGGGAGQESFRGILTFDPQPSDDGSFFVGLQYDPDNDGPLPARDLLPCIAPVFNAPVAAGGLVTSATLPPLESWCLAAGSFVASSDGTAFIPTAQVYGEQDPRFSFGK